MNDEFSGFSQGWMYFPNDILGIIAEIWAGRGIGPLHRYCAKGFIMRFPYAIAQGVMSGTIATLVEFRDRHVVRSWFLKAKFENHHQIGRGDPMMALRGCSTGVHDGLRCLWQANRRSGACHMQRLAPRGWMSLQDEVSI